MDAAFLAQALLRAPRALRDELDAGHPRRSWCAPWSRRACISPGFNNWLLFTATVEAALAKLGAAVGPHARGLRAAPARAVVQGRRRLRRRARFHWDYYNSFVIQPMLLDVLGRGGRRAPGLEGDAEPGEQARASATPRSRSASSRPTARFPAVGRSLAYRCGAFQAPGADGAAPRAARRRSPRPRCAARSPRSSAARSTRRARSTRTAGCASASAGHQPGVGERYISTGSLYLCAVALLPLGLPARRSVLVRPPQPWTAQRAWSGQPFPIDKALVD